MTEILYKSFDLKLADGDAGQFEGLASVFHNRDSGGDIIEPGAFRKTIRERGANIPILWQHDARQPIGVGEVRETASGLAIKGRILASVNRGREALILIREGIVNGLSIGYKPYPDKTAWDSERNARILKEVKLYEVSLVTFPMNEMATITATGPADEPKAEPSDFVEVLRGIRREQQVAATLRELRQQLSAPSQPKRWGGR